MPRGHLRWMHVLLHMGKCRSLPSLHGARLPWDWGSLQKRISGTATLSASQLGLFGYNLDSVEIHCAKRYASAGRVEKSLSRLWAGWVQVLLVRCCAETQRYLCPWQWGSWRRAGLCWTAVWVGTWTMYAFVHTGRLFEKDGVPKGLQSFNSHKHQGQTRRGFRVSIQKFILPCLQFFWFWLL